MYIYIYIPSSIPSGNFPQFAWNIIMELNRPWLPDREISAISYPITNSILSHYIQSISSFYP